MSEMSQTGAVVLFPASEESARNYTVLEDGNLVVAGRTKSWDGLLQKHICGAAAWDVKRGEVRYVLGEKRSFSESWECCFFYCIASLDSDLLVTVDSGAEKFRVNRTSTWKASTGKIIESRNDLISGTAITCAPLWLDETTFVVAAADSHDKRLAFFNHDHGRGVESAFEIGNAHRDSIVALPLLTLRLYVL